MTTTPTPTGLLSLLAPRRLAYLGKTIPLLWERRGQCPGTTPVLVRHEKIVVECNLGDVKKAKVWLKKAMIDGMDGALKDPCAEGPPSAGRRGSGRATTSQCRPRPSTQTPRELISCGRQNAPGTSQLLQLVSQELQEPDHALMPHKHRYAV